jgi:Armadillo/beta-catenin-like repeat
MCFNAVSHAALLLFSEQHCSGGKSDQIKYLVQQGCIPPLCELLTVHDAKIVTVALEGLENILKVHIQHHYMRTHERLRVLIDHAQLSTAVQPVSLIVP